MKNSVITLLVLLFATFYLYGQDQYESEYWQALNQKEKVIILQGIYKGLSEGLKVMGNEAERKKFEDPYWQSPFVMENSASQLKEYFSEKIGFDYENISALLDVFYSNPDNSHIEIMFALKVIMIGQDGETRRANELLLLKQKEALQGR